MLRTYLSGSSGDAQKGPGPNSERPSAVVTFAPIAAGLGAAALVAWMRCPAPPPHLLLWRDLVAFAAAHVAESAVAGGMGVLVVYAMLGDWANSEVPRITWHTIVVSVWLAPLAVFLAERSGWALVASTALVASATSLISRRVRFAGGEPEGAIDLYANDLFHLTPEPTLIERMLPALCASVSLQSGAVAASMGYMLPATALCGAGTAVIAYRKANDWQEQSTPPALRALLGLAVAAILTGGGLTRYLAVERGPDGSAGASERPFARVTGSVLRSIFPGDTSRRGDRSIGAAGAVKLGSVYPGIILLPESQPYATLVPPLPALHGGFPMPDQANPLSIPFFGAYWLFKAPDTSPPPTSIRTRGNPAEHLFTSTDHAPLFMEAHQNFGVLMSLNCCRAIQIAVRNADRFPGTVSLELILINSRLPGSPSQLLGSQRLESMPWQPRDDGRSFSETLTFAIPAERAIREFDQATVRFKLAALRADTAAKTAIDRFLFVPK